MDIFFFNKDCYNLYTCTYNNLSKNAITTFIDLMLLSILKEILFLLKTKNLLHTHALNYYKYTIFELKKYYK